MKKSKKKKFNPFLDLKKYSNNINPDREKKLLKEALEFIKIGDLDSAEEIYRKLVNLDTKNPNVFSNLAGILLKQNQNSGVEKLLKKAIDLNPKFSEAYSNLGAFYHSQKYFEKAIKYYEKALEINPNYPEANYNLGNALRDTNDNFNAKKFLKYAISLRSDYLEAHLNLAIILSKEKKIPECLEHLRKITNSKNKNSHILFLVGKLYLDLQLFRDAINLFQKSLEIDNNNLKAKNSLISTKKQICCWENYSNDFHEIKKLSDLLDFDQQNKNTYMYFADDLELHSRINKKFAAQNFGRIKSDFKVEKNNHKSDKVKIAYVSADFRSHPVTNLLYRIIELHDREKFEVIAFSLNNEFNDKLTNHLKKIFDKFIDLSSKTDEEIVKSIRNEKCNVVFDLMGYSRNARTNIFARRIAPIQISFLGYPGTMGANFIDFIIADKVLIPLDEQKLFSEKIIYLDKSPICFDDSLIDLSKSFKKEDYGLPSEGFIFNCFNNNIKISPEVFKIWMEILHEVENSYLWLYASNNLSKENLIKEAEDMKIPSSRLIFAEYLPLDQHLKRHKAADLCLDTFNFSAGATGVFALLSGIPIVTYFGKSFYSRMSSSLLKEFGLEELITKSYLQYKELVIEIATSKSKHKSLKEKLENNLKSKKNIYSKLFTEELESKLIDLL